MLNINKKRFLLVVEPDLSCDLPYVHLKQEYQMIRSATIETALFQLTQVIVPDLVLISTSLPVSDQLHLLEAVRNLCTNGIIPLIFVVNVKQRLNQVIGTSWGGAMGVLTTESSEREVQAVLNRIAQDQLPHYVRSELSRSPRPTLDIPVA